MSHIKWCQTAKVTSQKKTHLCGKLNTTGLQPVSKPVEQILGFFKKGFYSKKGAYNLITLTLYFSFLNSIRTKETLINTYIQN